MSRLDSRPNALMNERHINSKLQETNQHFGAVISNWVCGSLKVHRKVMALGEIGRWDQSKSQILVARLIRTDTRGTKKGLGAGGEMFEKGKERGQKRGAMGKRGSRMGGRRRVERMNGRKKGAMGKRGSRMGGRRRVERMNGRKKGAMGKRGSRMGGRMEEIEERRRGE
uniref:Uncharacterized protein n=1 Tax=Globodera rostochiensis TaxID=31243 RepID=A0A914GQA3_GLORO